MMSYCRWSSDNWQCDLYCYDDISGGITTHVAGYRCVKGRKRRIGLPHDGERFNDPDSKSFLRRLLYLRSLGYRFPDYVIEQVKKDIES